MTLRTLLLIEKKLISKGMHDNTGNTKTLYWAHIMSILTYRVLSRENLPVFYCFMASVKHANTKKVF